MNHVYYVMSVCSLYTGFCLAITVVNEYHLLYAYCVLRTLSRHYIHIPTMRPLLLHCPCEDLDTIV